MPGLSAPRIPTLLGDAYFHGMGFPCCSARRSPPPSLPTEYPGDRRRVSLRSQNHSLTFGLPHESKLPLVVGNVDASPARAAPLRDAQAGEEGGDPRCSSGHALALRHKSAALVAAPRRPTMHCVEIAGEAVSIRTLAVRSRSASPARSAGQAPFAVRRSSPRRFRRYRTSASWR